MYLPGGHVEAGEGMKPALARELDEELGADVEVGEYLGAVEHVWEVDGAISHEINHCFMVRSSELRAIHAPHSKEDHVEFTWLSPSEFEQRNLQPTPLRRLISRWETESSRHWWASTIELREE